MLYHPMALMYSPSGIPPPKTHNGLVLAIQGVRLSLTLHRLTSLTYSQLPPICKSKDGWKLVKDLLREVLAGRGMLDPIYGKPGMVHIKSGPVGQSTLNYQGTPHAEGRTEMVWAHCNMKTPAAAICAWRKCIMYDWSRSNTS